MQSAVFKKIDKSTFVENGFRMQGNHYYRQSEEVICVLGLQKSNYANGYYINIGYIIKTLNPSLLHPKYFNGDIRGRFHYTDSDREVDFFDLDQLPENDNSNLILIFSKNIKVYIPAELSVKTIQFLLTSFPDMLYQTSFKAKQFLGIE